MVWATLSRSLPLPMHRIAAVGGLGAATESP